MFKIDYQPKMTIETYNRLQNYIDNKNSELFIKTIVDFFYELQKTNLNWRMPLCIHLDEPLEYEEKEANNYDRDYWYGYLLKLEDNHYICFDTKQCVEMIKQCSGYFQYKDKLYRLSYYESEDCSPYNPLLKIIAELDKIRRIKENDR